MDPREKAVLQAQADVLLNDWFFRKTPTDTFFQTAKEEVAFTISRLEPPVRAALIVALMGSKMAMHDMAELAHELAAQMP